MSTIADIDRKRAVMDPMDKWRFKKWIWAPVEGLRFGTHVMCDTELVPGEGDELLVEQDGKWATEPWDGENYGFVVTAYCRYPHEEAVRESAEPTDGASPTH